MYFNVKDQYSQHNLHRRFPNSLENQTRDLEPDSINILDVRWRKILLLIIAITVHNIPGNFDRFFILYTEAK